MEILVIVIIRVRIAAETDGMTRTVLRAMEVAGDARHKNTEIIDALRKVARTTSRTRGNFVGTLLQDSIALTEASQAPAIATRQILIVEMHAA
jgi:hypothetical protein